MFAPQQLMAVLRMSHDQAGTWKALVLDDLEWLANLAHPSIEKLGLPRECPAAWQAFITAQPKQWKRMVRDAIRSNPCIELREHQICTESDVFECPACDQSFDSDRGRKLHMINYHKLWTVSLWYVTPSLTCPVCLKYVHTMTKLRDHLGANGRTSVCAKQCVLRQYPKIRPDQMCHVLQVLADERSANNVAGFHKKYNFAPSFAVPGPLEPMYRGPIDPRSTIEFLGTRVPVSC